MPNVSVSGNMFHRDAHELPSGQSLNFNAKKSRVVVVKGSGSDFYLAND